MFLIGWGDDALPALREQGTGVAERSGGRRGNDGEGDKEIKKHQGTVLLSPKMWSGKSRSGRHRTKKKKKKMTVPGNQRAYTVLLTCVAAHARSQSTIESDNLLCSYTG